MWYITFYFTEILLRYYVFHRRMFVVILHYVSRKMGCYCVLYHRKLVMVHIFLKVDSLCLIGITLS